MQAKRNKKKLLLFFAPMLGTMLTGVSATVANDSQNRYPFLHFYNSKDLLAQNQDAPSAIVAGLYNNSLDLKLQTNLDNAKVAKVAKYNWYGRSGAIDGSEYSSDRIGNRNYVEKGFKTLGITLSSNPKNALSLNSDSFFYKPDSPKFRQLASLLLNELSQLVQSAGINPPTDDFTKVVVEQVKDKIVQVAARPNLTGATIELSSIPSEKNYAIVPFFTNFDFENQTIQWLQSFVFSLKNYATNRFKYKWNEAKKTFEKEDNVVGDASWIQALKQTSNPAQFIYIKKQYEQIKQNANSFFDGKGGQVFEFNSDFDTAQITLIGQLGPFAAILNAYKDDNPFAPIIPTKDPLVIAYNPILPTVTTFLQSAAINTSVNIPPDVASGLAPAIADWVATQAAVAHISIETFLYNNATIINNAIVEAVENGDINTEKLTKSLMAQNTQITTGSNTNVAIEDYNALFAKLSNRQKLIDYLKLFHTLNSSDKLFKWDDSNVSLVEYLKQRLGDGSSAHVAKLNGNVSLDEIFKAIQQDMGVEHMREHFEANTNIFVADQTKILNALSVSIVNRDELNKVEFNQSGSIASEHIKLYNDLGKLYNDVNKVSKSYDIFTAMLADFNFEKHSQDLEKQWSQLQVASSNFEKFLSRAIRGNDLQLANFYNIILQKSVHRNNVSDSEYADYARGRDLGRLATTGSVLLNFFSFDFKGIGDDVIAQRDAENNAYDETFSTGITLNDFLIMQGATKMMLQINRVRLLAHFANDLLKLASKSIEEIVKDEQFKLIFKQLYNRDYQDLNDKNLAIVTVEKMIGTTAHYIAAYNHSVPFTYYNDQLSDWENLAAFVSQAAAMTSVVAKALDYNKTNSANNVLLPVEDYLKSDGNTISAQTNLHSTAVSQTYDYNLFDKILGIDLNRVFYDKIKTNLGHLGGAKPIITKLDSYVGQYYNANTSFPVFATIAYNMPVDNIYRDALYQSKTGSVFWDNPKNVAYNNAIATAFSQIFQLDKSVPLSSISGESNDASTNQSSILERFDKFLENGAGSTNALNQSQTNVGNDLVPLVYGSPLNQLEYQNIASADFDNKKLSDYESDNTLDFDPNFSVDASDLALLKSQPLDKNLITNLDKNLLAQLRPDHQLLVAQDNTIAKPIVTDNQNNTFISQSLSKLSQGTQGVRTYLQRNPIATKVAKNLVHAYVFKKAFYSKKNGVLRKIGEKLGKSLEKRLADGLISRGTNKVFGTELKRIIAKGQKVASAKGFKGFARQTGRKIGNRFSTKVALNTLTKNRISLIKGLPGKSVRKTAQKLADGFSKKIVKKAAQKSSKAVAKQAGKIAARATKLAAKITSRLGGVATFGVGLVVSFVIDGLINFFTFDLEKQAGYWAPIYPQDLESIVDNDLNEDPNRMAEVFNKLYALNGVKVIKTGNFNNNYIQAIASDNIFAASQAGRISGAPAVQISQVGAPGNLFYQRFVDQTMAQNIAGNKLGTSTLYYNTIDNTYNSVKFEASSPQQSYMQLASQTQLFDFGINYEQFFQNPISGSISVSALNNINDKTYFNQDGNYGAYGGVVNFSIADLLRGVTSLATVSNSDLTIKNEADTSIVDTPVEYGSLYNISTNDLTASGAPLTAAEKAANLSARNVSWVPIFGQWWAESKRDGAAAFKLDKLPNVQVFPYMPTGQAMEMIASLNGTGASRQSLFAYSTVSLKVIKLANGNLGLRVVQNILNNNLGAYTKDGGPLKFEFTNAFYSAAIYDNTQFDKTFLQSAIGKIEDTINTDKFATLSIDESSNFTAGSNLNIDLNTAARNGNLIIFDKPLEVNNLLINNYTRNLRRLILENLQNATTQVSTIDGNVINNKLQEQNLALVQDIDITNLQIKPYFNSQGNIVARVVFDVTLAGKYNNKNVVLTFAIGNRIQDGKWEPTYQNALTLKPIELRVASAFLLKKILADSLKIHEYNAFSQSNYDLLAAYQNNKEVDPNKIQDLESQYFAALDIEYDFRVSQINFDKIYAILDPTNKMLLSTAYSQVPKAGKPAVVADFYEKLSLAQKTIIQAQADDDIKAIAKPDVARLAYRKHKFASDVERMQWLAGQLGYLYFDKNYYRDEEELAQAFENNTSEFNVELTNPFSFEVYDNKDLNLAGGGYVEFVDNFKGQSYRSINLKGNKVTFAWELNNFDNQERIYYNEYQKVKVPYQIIYHLIDNKGKANTIVINFILPDLTVADYSFKQDIDPKLLPIYASKYINVKNLGPGKSINNINLDDLNNIENLSAVFGDDPDALANQYFSANAQDASVQAAAKVFENQAKVGDNSRFASFIVANPFYVLRNERAKSSGLVNDVYLLKGNAKINEMHYRGAQASIINADVPFKAVDVTYLFDNSRILTLNGLPNGTTVSYFRTDDANTAVSEIKTVKYQENQINLDFGAFGPIYNGLYKLSFTVPQGKSFFTFNKLVFISPNNAIAVKNPLSEVNDYLQQKHNGYYLALLENDSDFATIAPLIQNGKSYSTIAYNDLYRNYLLNSNKRIVASFKYQNIAALARAEFIKINHLTDQPGINLFHPLTLADYNNKFTSALARNNDIAILNNLITQNEFNLQTNLNLKKQAASKVAEAENQISKLTTFKSENNIEDYRTFNQVLPVSVLQWKQFVLRKYLKEQSLNDHLIITNDLINKMEVFLADTNSDKGKFEEFKKQEQQAQTQGGISVSSTNESTSSKLSHNNLKSLQGAVEQKIEYDKWQKRKASKVELFDWLSTAIDILSNLQIAPWTLPTNGNQTIEDFDNPNTTEVKDFHTQNSFSTLTVGDDNYPLQTTITYDITAKKFNYQYKISGLNHPIDPQVLSLVSTFVDKANFSAIEHSIIVNDDDLENVLDQLIYLIIALDTKDNSISTSVSESSTSKSKFSLFLLDHDLDDSDETNSDDGNEKHRDISFKNEVQSDQFEQNANAKEKQFTSLYKSDANLKAILEYFKVPKEFTKQYVGAHIDEQINLLHKYNLIFASLPLDWNVAIDNEINKNQDIITANSQDFDVTISDLQSSVEFYKKQLAKLSGQDKLFMQQWFEQLAVQSPNESKIKVSEYVDFLKDKHITTNKEFLAQTKEFLKVKNIHSPFLDQIITSFEKVEKSLAELSGISSSVLPKDNADAPALEYLAGQINSKLAAEVDFKQLQQMFGINDLANSQVTKIFENKKVSGFIASTRADGPNSYVVLQLLLQSLDKSSKQVAIIKFAYDSDVQYYLADASAYLTDGKWNKVEEWDATRQSTLARLADNKDYILQFKTFDNKFIIDDTSVKHSDLGDPNFANLFNTVVSNIKLDDFNNLFSTALLQDLGQYNFLFENNFVVKELTSPPQDTTEAATVATEDATKLGAIAHYYELTNSRYKLDFKVYFAQKAGDYGGVLTIYEDGHKVQIVPLPTIFGTPLSIIDIKNLSAVLKNDNPDVRLLDDLITGKSEAIVFDNSKIDKVLKLVNLKFSTQANGFFAPLGLHYGNSWKNYRYRLSLNTSKHLDYLTSDALGYLFLNLKLEVFVPFARPFVSQPFVVAIAGVNSGYQFVNSGKSQEVASTDLVSLVQQNIKDIQYNDLYFQSRYLKTYLDNTGVLNWKSAIFFALNYYPYISNELSSINNTDGNIKDKVDFIWQYILNHLEIKQNDTFDSIIKFLVDNNLFSNIQHVSRDLQSSIDFASNMVYTASHYRYEKIIALANLSYQISFIDTADAQKAKVAQMVLNTPNETNPFAQFGLHFDGKKRYLSAAVATIGGQIEVGLVTSQQPVEFNLSDLLTPSERQLNRDAQNEIITKRLVQVSQKLQVITELLRAQVNYSPSDKQVNVSFNDNINLSFTPIYHYNKSALALTSEYQYQPKQLLFNDFNPQMAHIHNSDGTVNIENLTYIKSLLNLNPASPYATVEPQISLVAVKVQNEFNSYIYEVISDKFEPTYFQINAAGALGLKEQTFNNLDAKVIKTSDQFARPTSQIKLSNSLSYAPQISEFYSVISETKTTSKPLSTGASVGVALGAVLGTIGTAIIGWFGFKRIRSKRNPKA